MVAQIGSAGIKIQGHPTATYNGVYRVTSEHNGYPVMKNDAGMYCYYYSAIGKWFLWKEFTPDENKANCNIAAADTSASISMTYKAT